MLDPYRMIVVNIVAVFTLITVLTIYKFVYPKRNINFFVLLILICILPSISIFRIGTYESGDFNIHIYRAMAFYDSLSEGNFMPSWAEELNATYGYPLFIFNYVTLYYIISFFHFIGFSFIASMKLFLVLNIFLSGVFMYLFSKEITKSKFAAFTASIFYVFAPYFLVDVHFKAGGEILALTLIPILFYVFTRLLKQNKLNLILISSLVLSFFIASHAIMAIFTTGFLIAYLFFLALKEKKLPHTGIFLAFTFTFFISSYLWVAPLFLSKYTYTQNFPLVIGYSPKLSELLFAPFLFGLLFQGPKGELSYLIGYAHIAVTVLISFMFITKSIAKKYFSDQLFWLISFFIIIFLILPYSRFIWEYFSFVKAAGSHRLLILIVFCTSVLSGYLTLNLYKKRTIIYLLILIAIGSTILNWGHRRVIPEISDKTLRANLWKSTSEGEGHYYANTKWVDKKNLWFSKIPEAHLQPISGIAIVKEVSRNSTRHIYKIDVKSEGKFLENTLYFPGWEGKINNKIIPVKSSKKGVISFQLPKGKYTLEISYKDILIYKISKMISILSFSFAIGYLIYYLFKKMGLNV